MSWTVRRLQDVPSVPRTDDGDPDWRPLQHFFGLTAFGANVFIAARGDETLVAEHDEGASVADRGVAVAVREPAVKRRAVARKAGASLLVVGSCPGCFETTWRASHFADVPRA